VPNDKDSELCDPLNLEKLLEKRDDPQMNLAFKAASAFFLSSCSYRSQWWHGICLQAALSNLL